MENKNRKPRMYEPWGYQEENNYQSDEIIHENDLDSFFSDTEYVKDDNKIYFYNRDGNEVAELDVSEFVKSDSIIEKTEYSDGILKITFTNGDVITIDLTQLLDENEFKDGLIVSDHVVKVLVDPTSERWLTVSQDGVKVSGIQAEIDRLDERIDDEIARATSEEQRIETKLDQEIADRIADIDEEENRAKAVEQTLTTNLNNEITRATRTEQALNSRVDTLNDEIDAEESIREANDAALGLRITTETNDRISAVTAERNRAEAAEQALQNAIDGEVSRATSAETELSNAIIDETNRAIAAEQALDERIDEITSGSSFEKLDELIEKLGYKDNDTLERTDEHEVAFGEYNVSNTSVDPSGQTIFSIGIGTSDNDRKNALEVRKDGSVYMWIEGGYVQINNLLAQLTNEVYDTNP